MTLSASPHYRYVLLSLFLSTAMLSPSLAFSQGSVNQSDSSPILEPASLPQAPSAAPAPQSQNQQPADNATKKQPPQAQSDDRAQQTKRILDILPNFRSVSTDEILPAQSAKEKFLTATDDSFDYSSVFIPVALAGYGYLRKATPEFGTGPGAYGQYLWHSAVDQTTENYFVEFVVPAIAHQDNRYYTLGRGGFLKRTGYALSRAVITRSDSAHEEFNVSEVLGAGASAALSTAYYPASQRTIGNVASSWGVDVGIDGASFVIKEFWPDINRKWMHRVNSSHPVQ